jgi:hypothetical protein
MLERLEDMEDLQMLEDMRSTSLKFRSLEEFLKEYTPGVWGISRTENGTWS